MKILIIDSDKFFVESLKYSFDKEKYIIKTSFDGKNILNRIEKENYNLILMDIILPNIDGLDLCRLIREKSNIPIIIISEKDEDINKILALEYGADDYLVKPFNTLELKARIKAIFRRYSYGQENNHLKKVKIGDFKIDILNRDIEIFNKKVDLTGKEFELFYNLISNPGKIFNRDELLNLVWTYDYCRDIRTVDVHIRKIREKVEIEPMNPEYILTKWGKGYYYNKTKM